MTETITREAEQADPFAGINRGLTGTAAANGAIDRLHAAVAEADRKAGEADRPSDADIFRRRSEDHAEARRMLRKIAEDFPFPPAADATLAERCVAGHIHRAIDDETFAASDWGKLAAAAEAQAEAVAEAQGKAGL